MIYDTTFKNLIVDCFSRNAYNVRLEFGLLVVYSGDMPTYEQFISDWSALYFVTEGGNSSYPIDNSFQDRGTNVLCAYGSSLGDNSIVVKTINNEFYYDTATTIASDKLTDGTPGFACFFPYAPTHNYVQTTNMEHKPFLLLSVSDTSGSGIVKLSTLDTTLSGAAPTLMSMEFEVNMGA
jgi:hypothetical protein